MLTSSFARPQDPLWCPLGKFANCCPRVAVGSIALPSQGADPTDPSNNKNVASSGGMMSFGLNTSMHEAAKVFIKLEEAVHAV